MNTFPSKRIQFRNFAYILPPLSAHPLQPSSYTRIKILAFLLYFSSRYVLKENIYLYFLLLLFVCSKANNFSVNLFSSSFCLKFHAYLFFQLNQLLNTKFSFLSETGMRFFIKFEMCRKYKYFLPPV